MATSHRTGIHIVHTTSGFRYGEPWHDKIHRPGSLPRVQDRAVRVLRQQAQRKSYRRSAARHRSVQRGRVFRLCHRPNDAAKLFHNSVLAASGISRRPKTLFPAVSGIPQKGTSISMKQPLHIQVAQAHSAYLRSARDHPRSAVTTKLWFAFRNLRTKELAAINRADKREKRAA